MLGVRALRLLQEWGCCRRCMLIFLGERSDLLYGDMAVIDDTLKSAAAKIKDESEPENGVSAQVSESEQKEEEPSLQEGSEASGNQESKVRVSLEDTNYDHMAKKQRCSVCITCLGLLQWGCSSDAVKLLSDAISSRGNDGDAFALALSFPMCLSLRVHRVWTLLLQALPKFPEKGRIDHVGTIKEVWKNLVGPEIEVSIKRKFITKKYFDFILNVNATHSRDMVECEIMEKLCTAMFTVRRQQHRKYSNTVFTKQAIDTAIKKVSDEEFLKACPEPPCVPDEAIIFQSLQCQQTSIFMAGRYNKYSRELPQTPWLVEGERKMETSVQELICESLIGAVKADDVKFSSSGREDVDVRCLGTGRPFVVEFINPCRTKFTRSEMKDLQAAINSNTKLVALRDLQVVDRKDVKVLKEGEEEKTKAYCALCLARDGYDPKVLDRLSGMTELTLCQKTPIRVLHRRCLATRRKIIHKMLASRVDDYFFKLHLTTQAGTYIKEFVHGDLGRTTPSLGSLLGLEVDIIALDVENVALDWPPRCDD
ncbi:tRNA pseudouridine synthase Pus10-like [Penaeus monodon]|uniref:tRNA pseudouridine synthase Pus10-like n=1 Tax=Penaeus monodon TaxID=6687 RepID=UPI0018A784FB|nr:tRNA pseudouridine synthase Pus10-like [Penaeus monodon]